MTSRNRAATATAVVFINGVASGSAVLVSPTHLLTAAHVVRQGARIELIFPSSPGRGSLLATEIFRSELVDLVVLEFSSATEAAAPIAIAPLRRIPTTSSAFGFPQAEKEHHGVWRDFRVSGETSTQLVQIAWSDGAGTLPGQSGGPVVDANGDLLGIVLGGAPQAGFDRYLPCTAVETVWPALPRPWPAIGDGAAGHFARRARGHHTNRRGGDLFRGREKALAAVATHLAKRSSGLPLMVTGAPGSGKSAVLARGAMEAEREPSVVGITFHAKGAREIHLLDGVAAALGAVTPDSIEDLVDTARNIDRRIVLFVDALDEAATATEALALCDVLAAMAALPNVRVVAGSRREIDGHDTLLRRLGVGDHPSSIIDLDDETYRDDRAVESFALALLRQDGFTSPGPSTGAWRTYRDRPEAANALAHHITRVSRGNFLVATLAASALSTKADVHDPAARHFDASVIPTSVGDALEKYLASLRRKPRARAQGLLTALAHARGSGISMTRWHLFATAIGVRASARDIERFRTSGAVNYLVLTTAASGEEVVQLFHQALVDELIRRGGRRDSQAIFDAMVEQVDSSGGWSAADGYTLAHLVEHAPNASSLDSLLRMDDYAVVAEPARLVEAVGANITQLSSPIARIIENEASRFVRSTESGRRLLVSCAAAHSGNPELIRAVLPASAPLVPKWATPLDLHHVKLIGHTGTVLAVHVSRTSDGSDVVVTGGVDRTMRVWDRYGRHLGTVETPGSVHSIADGSTAGVVYVAGPNFVAGVDLSLRTMLWVHEEGGINATAVTANIEGEGAIVATRRAIAIVSQAHGRSPLWTRSRSSVAFSKFGDLAVVAGAGKLVVLQIPVMVETAALVFRSRARSVATADIAGERLVAVAMTDRSIAMAELGPGAQLRTLGSIQQHPRAISLGQLAGKTSVAVGGSGRNIEVFDADGERRELTGHSGGIAALAIGHVGRHAVLVSGSTDGTGRIWREGQQNFRSRATGGAAILCLGDAVDSSGKVVLVAGDVAGALQSWRADGKPLGGRTISTSPIRAVAVGHVAGRLLVASTSGRTVRVTAGIDGEILWEANTDGRQLTAVLILSEGTVIAGSKDGCLYAWPDGGGEPIVVAAHRRDVFALQRLLINNEEYVLCTGRDGRVEIRRPTLELHRTLLHGGASARSAATIGHGDDAYIAIGQDSRVLVWKASQLENSPTTLHTTPGPVSGVSFVMFGDELCVASSSSGVAALRVISLTSGRVHVMPTAEPVSCLVGLNSALVAASGPAVIHFEARQTATTEMWSPRGFVEIAEEVHGTQTGFSSGQLRLLAQEQLRAGMYAESLRLAARLPGGVADIALRADAAFGAGDVDALRGLLASSITGHSSQMRGRRLGIAAAIEDDNEVKAELDRLAGQGAAWEEFVGMHSMFSRNGELEWIAQKRLVRVSLADNRTTLPDIVSQVSSRILAVARFISTGDVDAFDIKTEALVAELVELAPDLERRLASLFDTIELDILQFRPYQLLSIMEVRRHLTGRDEPAMLQILDETVDHAPEGVEVRMREWAEYSPVARTWISRREPRSGR